MGVARLALILLAFFGVEALAASGITYQGRLLKPDGSPVTSSNVQFKMQIRTPGGEDCLLYEETQTIDLSATSGVFAVSVGDGTGTRTDAHAADWNLFEALSNRKDFSFSSSECTGVNTYAPNPADNRRFRVFFDLGSGWESLPTQTINYIPMSIESYAVGGFPSKSLFRVEDSGVIGDVAALTTSQYNSLVSLANGSSAVYEKSGELGGSAIPSSLTSGQSFVSDGAGGWVASMPLTSETDPNVQAFAKTSLPTCSTGEALASDGTTLTCVSVASGSLSESDIPKLTSAGNGVDGGAISGEIGGSTSINTSGNITTTGSLSVSGSVTTGSFSTRQFDLYDSDDTNKISFFAPATGDLAADYNLVFPSVAGSSNQLLGMNNAGTALENKTLTGDTGVTITHSVGGIAIAVDTSGKMDKTLSNGMAWLGDSGGQAAERFIYVSDIRSSKGPSYVSFFPSTCTNAQTMTWQSATDTMICSDISIPSSKVTDLDTNYFKQGGNDFGATATLGTTGSNGLNFITNNTAKMTLLSNGNVGIGTTAPGALLELQGPATGNGLWIKAGEDDVTDYILKLQDQDASMTAMLVRADGTVSIPQDLDASLSGGGSVIVGDTAGLNLAIDTNEIMARANGSASDLYLQNEGGSTIVGGQTNIFYDEGINSGAHTLFRAYRKGGSSFGVGLGYMADGVSESAAMIRPVGAAPDLVFANDMGAERMRITTGGKIGIGTTNPVVSLDVGEKTDAVRLPAGTTGEQPAVPANGMIRYNSDSNKFEAYENSAWVNMIGGTASSATSVSAGAGSNAAPSISFSGDPNTGFYSSGADTIGISTGGTKVWDITTTGIVSPTAGGASISSGVGSAAAPTFSFAGDPDTGWFHPTADTLAASTGGLERVRIDSSGNVGIGTANPQRPLHVYGAGSLSKAWFESPDSSAVISIRSAAGAFDSSVNFAKGNRNRWQLNGANSTTESGGNTGSNFSIYRYDDSGAAIDAPLTILRSSGNVGIGTTAPVSTLQLGSQIGSNIPAVSIRTDIVSKTALRIQPGAGGFPFVAHKSDGVEAFVINDSGDVGIGTNVPLAKFHSRSSTGGVMAVFDDTFRDRRLDIISDSSGGDSYIGLNAHEYLTTANPMNMVFQTGGTERVRVTSSGNVGIGTTNPSSLLSVANPSGSASATFYGADASQTGLNIGVGTNNRWLLYQDVAANGRTLGIWHDHSGVGGSMGQLMTFTNAGNVGIGTTNPTALLHVNGAALATVWNTSSDVRLKEHITEIENPLDKILQLRGVEFDWRSDVGAPTKHDQTHDIGVIAQEVEKVFPEAVTSPKDGGYKSVAYSKLIAPVIGAIQELYHRVINVEEQKDAQNREIASLKEKVSRLEEEKNQQGRQIEQLTAALCETNPGAEICRK